MDLCKSAPGFVYNTVYLIYVEGEVASSKEISNKS